MPAEVPESQLGSPSPRGCPQPSAELCSGPPRAARATPGCSSRRAFVQQAPAQRSPDPLPMALASVTGRLLRNEGGALFLGGPMPESTQGHQGGARGRMDARAGSCPCPPCSLTPAPCLPHSPHPALLLSHYPFPLSHFPPPPPLPLSPIPPTTASTPLLLARCRPPRHFLHPIPPGLHRLPRPVFAVSAMLLRGRRGAATGAISGHCAGGCGAPPAFLRPHIPRRDTLGHVTRAQCSMHYA